MLLPLVLRDAPAPARHERPLALLLVRNAVSHDARVLRAARAAAGAIDGDALIVGVASEAAAPGETTINGVAIMRLAPWSRAARIRRALGRTARASSPQIRPVDGSSPSNAPPRLTAGARLRRVALGASFVVQALAVARRRRPVLVHANDWNTMWAGIAIKLVYRVPLLYDSHELWADRNGRWEWRPWLLASEALFVRAADQVITASPGYARELARRYRVREPSLVRNIPDREGTDPTPPSEPPVVAYVGGLMRGRGLEQMIDALPHLRDVRLSVIGPGGAAYRAALRERAIRLGVADRMALLDPVGPADVQKALAGSAIGLCLIQPVCRSYELSLPNKLFEYVTAGVPVLASDLPVIASVVRESGIGEVVAAADPVSIAAGVERLLNPEVRAAAVLGARTFAATNTWPREAEALVGAYRRISRAPKPR
jgi:glycosyltransferase involved in cell wall biosynthesis